MPLSHCSDSSTSKNLLILKCLFFLSGAAGLIYEVVWTRLFSNILGSTVIAMTVTFSVFLLALAAGAWLFGRLQVTSRPALRLYGTLEIGIGASSLLASIILWNGRYWLATNVPESDSFLISVLIKLLVTAMLIGPPTILMGATLPVIVGAAKAWVSPRSVVTQFYGWNTVGAALGTAATGFVLIWQLGLILTLTTAILINLVVGVFSLVLSKRCPTENPAEPPVESTESTRREPIWIFLAFVSGFGVLGYEILWARMARFLLGDRTLAITSLLFIFIVCLGFASLVVPRLARHFDKTQALELVAFSLLAGSLLHLLFVPLARATIAGGGLVPLVPVVNEFLRRNLTTGFLIAPSILILGFVFPLLVWTAKKLNEAPGKTIGELYFINTVGSVLGAVSASYFLSRNLGTLGGFLAITGLLLVSALIVVSLKSGRMMKACAVLSIPLFLAGAYRFPGDLIELRSDERLLASNEDEYGVQVLTLTSRNTIRVRNNRLQLIYDLGHPQTSHAQQMSAHLTALLAKSCKEVLNVGTGYGITAGTYTLYPDVRSVRSVEILPFLVRNQTRFAGYNFNYLNDPRVRLIQGDGRNELVANPRSYDIISVNVLDPYLPGSSALYTVEFWRMVRDRLKKGGVFTQLFWGEDLELLVKGLRTVFPTALYFPAYGDTSFNVVAFAEAVSPASLQLKLDRLTPRIEEEILELTGTEAASLFRSLLDQAWRSNPFFERLAARPAGRLHTDNYPILEYRWAHGVRNVSNLDSPLVEQ